MRLYLDPRLDSIKTISILKSLFEGNPDLDILPIESSEGYFKVSQIYETPHHEDKVREFVEAYVSSLPENKFPKEVLPYITNRLYAAKGYPEVFEVLRELLSVPDSEDYPFIVIPTFTGNFLSKLTFQQVKSLDFDLVYKKLIDALYHLLLLGSIKSLVEDITLGVLMEGSVETSTLGVGFSIFLLDYGRN